MATQKTEMTFDKWEEKFKPLGNPNNDGSGPNMVDQDDNECFMMFETYDEDRDCIIDAHKKNPNHVWTYIEDDKGNLCVVNGYHQVDVFGYFMTQVPFEKGQHIEAYDPDMVEHNASQAALEANGASSLNTDHD